LVETHLDELIESFRDPNDPDAAIPTFVEKEFRSYLACGDPSRGFIRLFCDRCQHEHPLPFSCKGRAICASCGARRMSATSAHLVDHVLPDVPIRQYVLSPPFELRGLLACSGDVLSKLSQIFVSAIFRRMKRWAKTQGLTRAQCGAIVAIQRFTKTLSISPHLHVLVLDGVFVDDEQTTLPRFFDCPPPTECDLLDLAQEVLEKMTRYLKKRGYLFDHAEENLTATDRWFLRGLAGLSEPSPILSRRSGTSLNTVPKALELRHSSSSGSESVLLPASSMHLVVERSASALTSPSSPAGLCYAICVPRASHCPGPFNHHRGPGLDHIAFDPSRPRTPALRVIAFGTPIDLRLRYLR